MGRTKYATEEERQAAVRAQKRAYFERYPERRKASSKAYFERLKADPERYARRLEQGRESYARNPQTAYLYALAYRAKNRDAVRAVNREAATRRRTRVERNAEVDAFALVLRADPCAYCGKASSVIDHIVPVADDGQHEVENLTGACRSCNARKRTQPLLIFLLKQASA